MAKLFNIRFVEEQINNICYDYDIIYNVIEKIMKEGDVVEPCENNINIFGLFNINLDMIPDIIPDIIEKQTIMAKLIPMFDYLQHLEISYDIFRFKINLYPTYDNTIKEITKSRTSNEDIKRILKDLCMNKNIKKNIFNTGIDDKLFMYMCLLLLSIFESSSFVLLNHQLNIELIPLETELIELEVDNPIIKKIIESIKGIDT